MLLIKFTPERAEELAKKLSTISEKSGSCGYLVGLIQDTKRCVKANLENDTDKDLGDDKVIEEVTGLLTNAENLLSAILSTAILRGKDNKEK